MHFVAIRAPLRTGYVCLSSISLCERKGTGRVPFFSWWAKFLITSGAQVIISSPAGRVLTMVPLVRGKTAIFCNIEYQLQVWFQMHWYTWTINMTQMCHILTFPGPSCQPGRIFMVQNGWYRCPAYSSTCLMFNPHLWGVFSAPKVKYIKNIQFLR